MAKYTVKISVTEWYETTIEANDMEDAWDKAQDETCEGDPSNWKELDGCYEVNVYSVNELK